MKRIFIVLGVDRAIAYTLIGRAWSMLAGLITIWFITKYLSTTEQGFYYTFASLLGLQIVFELGMSYVVMQFASHEMAHLKWTLEGKLEGDEKAKSRLSSLLILVAKWYGTISILIVIAILPAGWIFFSMNIHDTDVSWKIAWIWLVLSAALNIFIVPIFALLEGCGLVSQVARIRMVQGVGGSIACWLIFVCEGRLLAMPAMNSIMLVIGLIWLWVGYRNFFKSLLLTQLPINPINWRIEIWPFQWRIALSWLSGYLIFQLFSPALFAYRGPIEAGQLGMSLSIVGAISSIAIAWVNTKTPQFGHFVAMKRFQALDILFFQTLKQSTFVVMLGGIVILLLKLYLASIASPLNERLLPIIPFSLLLLTAIVNHIIFAEAAYLRSHKAEPFMVLSLTTGLLITCVIFLFGKQFGALGMMASYFLISLIVGLGWGSWIFHQKKLAWHEIKQEPQIA